MDPYASKRRRVARKLKKWSTGNVTLSRKTRGERDPEKKWVPGEATIDIYRLDAVVNGVAAEFVNGKEIVASDLQVDASPKATHVSSAGVDLNPPVVVDLEPRMSDTLQVDGEEKVIKGIKAFPTAGPAAKFLIFVAS